VPSNKVVESVAKSDRRRVWAIEFGRIGLVLGEYYCLVRTWQCQCRRLSHFTVLRELENSTSRCLCLSHKGGRASEDDEDPDSVVRTLKQKTHREWLTQGLPSLVTSDESQNPSHHVCCERESRLAKSTLASTGAFLRDKRPVLVCWTHLPSKGNF
jgi:hypothetical protein